MPYVMTYGGGRYTSVAWFPAHAEAQAECERIRRAGTWSGMPPVVEDDLPQHWHIVAACQDAWKEGRQ